MKQRPRYFDQWSELWTGWEAWLGKSGVTPIEACVGFVLHQAAVCRAVVGVDNVIQAEQIIAAARLDATDWPENLSTDEIQLLNPSLWPKVNR